MMILPDVLQPDLKVVFWVSKWIARRLPVEVAFTLDGLGWAEVREVERYIKRWTRARKQALIDGDERVLALVERRIEGWRSGNRWEKSDGLSPI